jgi:predicted TIM-barrel fold metal-dependent hydrolase
MIVDAHVHVFPDVCGLTVAGPTRGLGGGRIAVGDAELQLTPPSGDRTAHTVEMLLADMDQAGVQRAVLLQGPLYGDWNPYVLDAIRHCRERLAGIAYLDPWAPGCPQAFQGLFASSGFAGVKLEFTESTGLCGIHPDARLDDHDVAWLWDELERQGLVLVVDLGPVGSCSYQTGALRRIADEHHNLRIVIAHLAQPCPGAERDPELWRLWREQIDVGRLPNVWFDSAALPAYLADEGYPYPSAERYLQLAIERIGPDKVMWGSDAPGLLCHATYPTLVELAGLHTRFLSPGDRAMVLGGNALRVYGGESVESE